MFNFIAVRYQAVHHDQTTLEYILIAIEDELAKIGIGIELENGTKNYRH
jgi:hypothetical protein